MTNLLISIIVPNYNHAPFLEQRLESVFNQTYTNFEVILLDDFSIDGSREVLLRYIDHPKLSHYIFNKKNSANPFLQWQKGIELAKGDYIWIAESDDYCELEFLEILIENIKPSTALVYSASMNVDENGMLLGLNRNQESIDKTRWLLDFHNNGKNEIKNYLRFKNTIPNSSAVIFKKEYFQSSFITADFKYCGDWIFWLNLLKFGDVQFIATPLNYFRFHDNTTRVSKSIDKDVAMFKEFFKVIRREGNIYILLKFADKYGWIPEALRLFSNKHPNAAIFKRLRRKNRWLLRLWSFQFKNNILSK